MCYRISKGIRLTNVGALNPELYSDTLKQLCRRNDVRLREARMRVKTDSLAGDLERARGAELEGLGHDDTQSVYSGTGSMLRYCLGAEA